MKVCSRFFLQSCKQMPTDEHASLGVVKLRLNEFTQHTCEVNKGPHFLKELPEFIGNKELRDYVAIKSTVGSILTAIEVCSGNNYEHFLKMCALRGIDIYDTTRILVLRKVNG